MKKITDNHIRALEREIKKIITLHNLGKIPTNAARDEINFLERIIKDLTYDLPENKRIKYLVNREILL